jgi:hypothetical protein
VLSILMHVYRLFSAYKEPSSKASAGDDIKRLDAATRLNVNRRLRKLGALKLQHSVWVHNDLSELKNLADAIKSSGGNAFIMHKKSLPSDTRVSSTAIAPNSQSFKFIRAITD